MIPTMKKSDLVHWIANMKYGQKFIGYNILTQESGNYLKNMIHMSLNAKNGDICAPSFGHNRERQRLKFLAILEDIYLVISC